MAFVYIGNVKIEKTAALAPMAGVANSAFRLICKEFGAALVVSEMISAKAVCFKDKKTKTLLKFNKEERPIAIQIFGYISRDMSEAAKIIEEYAQPDIIDINMGCPAPKIAGNFSGCSLMKEPVLAGKIIKEVCKAAQAPITVKIRKGWSRNSINAVEIAKIAQESGAAAVTIHGRTKEELFSGKVDLNIIKQVKDSVKIPVIGNGDITCGKEAEEMYQKTGCDLVMVGRGALGRPWVFREINNHLLNKVGYITPTWYEITKIMLKHGQMLCTECGELNGMKQMRKHVMWYTKKLEGGAKVRKKASELKTLLQLKDLAEEILNIASVY